MGFEGIMKTVIRSLALVLATPLAAAAVCTWQIVGDDLIIDGCNVHIQNGSGQPCGFPYAGELCSTSTNGLGNLIIGYNGPRNPGVAVRTGPTTWSLVTATATARTEGSRPV